MAKEPKKEGAVSQGSSQGRFFGAECWHVEVSQLLGWKSATEGGDTLAGSRELTWLYLI